MYVRVLGAAAGGGFPQWNCSCNNCRRLRQESFSGSARSQAQLAISSDAENWFLVNASPDLRYQIESFVSLHPRPSAVRQSPIQGVVLTSAEVDAALGLLLLRESQPLVIYATESVRSLLMDDNNVFNVLRRQPDQVRWRTIVLNRSFELRSTRDHSTGIQCTALPTGGAFPGHVALERAKDFDRSEAVIGLTLEHGSKRMAFLPGAQVITPEWMREMARCDLILVDGTFWSDDELIRLQGQGKTAREMGHSPVGGPGGTIEMLSTLTMPRKIFIHVNNTNPMLDEESSEYREMRAAGWELAADGMDLRL